MKARYFWMALAIALTSVGVGATSLPLTGNLDVAMTQNQPVFAGWEVNLVSGSHPVGVTVARLNNCTQEIKILSPVSVNWGDRPDVRAFFAAQGVFIQPTVGYGIILQPQAPGNYTYTILFTDAPTAQAADSYSIRMTVPAPACPAGQNCQSTAVILE